MQRASGIGLWPELARSRSLLFLDTTNHNICPPLHSHRVADPVTSQVTDDIIIKTWGGSLMILMMTAGDEDQIKLEEEGAE